MGVVASAQGIVKMRNVVNSKNLSSNYYEKMSADLDGLTNRTISKFLTGKAVRASTACQIIEYLGFQREDIITDPEWNKKVPISLEELWDELYELATFAPKRLAVKLAQLEEASFRDRGKPQYVTQIVAGSAVWIDVYVQQSGYLVLLEMDETGEIVCLSPSEYVPNPQLEPGLQRTPQQESEDRVFKPATLGEDILIAAILPERPNFDWLSGEDARVLDQENLSQLLEYVKKSKQPIDLIRSSVRII